MNSTANLATLLQGFFTKRLMSQRQASAHTINAYRDTFRLLLLFAQQRLQKVPSRLSFSELDAPLIAEFLNDLEHNRKNTARSRNMRLTGIGDTKGAVDSLLGVCNDGGVSCSRTERRSGALQLGACVRSAWGHPAGA
jgi:Phage integrase, N-terminal SAM-like domain